jgi:hypothetical protein
MKSAIRASAMHEIGMRLDDALDSAQKNALRAEGRVDALVTASKACARIAEQFVEEAKQSEMAPEVAEITRRWVLRCAFAVESLAKTASNEATEARGAAAGLAKGVAITKAMHAAAASETERVAAIASGEESSEGIEPPIKLQRQAEESKRGRRRASNS